MNSCPMNISLIALPSPAILHLCSAGNENHYWEQLEIEGLISKAHVTALCRIGIVETPPLLPTSSRGTILNSG
jgi:hypothetical protein